VSDLWSPLLPTVREDLSFTTTVPSRPDGSPRTFGGHLSSIAVAAACSSAPGCSPHSVHSMFLRPAASTVPIDGAVRVIRDGRQFSQRRVELDQGGRRVFEATVSLQAPRDDAPEPLPLPSPVEGVPTAEESAGRGMPFPSTSTDEWYEQRLVAEDPLVFWARAIAGLPRNPVACYAAIAGMTDIGLVRAASPRAAAGVSDEYGQPRGVTLEHSLWFHRLPQADDWLLLVTDGAESEAGRALARGRVWNAAGELCATYVQDVLSHPHA